MKFCRLLLFQFLLILNLDASYSTTEGNKMADRLIQNIREEMKKRNFDSVKLPDQKREIPIGFLKAKVNLTKGWIKSLTSLQRDGDVVFRIEGNSSILMGNYNFSDLTFGYLNSHIKFGIFHSNFPLEGKVGSHAIHVVISSTRKHSRCISKLEHLELVKLDGVWITSGTTIYDKIVRTVINNFLKTKIEKMMEKANEAVKYLIGVNYPIPGIDLCSNERF